MSDMQWSNAEASYGYVQRDQSVEGKPLELLMNGSSRTFSKGVGFNATAQLDVNISGLGFKPGNLLIEDNIPMKILQQ